MANNQKHIVICGAGVIGASIAYYLSLRKNENVKITVVERCSPAIGASGKAGGFLAQDWCDGGILEPLARKGFQLHCELAAQLNGSEKYGFRLLDTYAVSAAAAITEKEKPFIKPPPLDWLSVDSFTKHSVLGTTTNTGQVHPYFFTNTLLDEAKANGVSLVIGKVEGLEFSTNSEGKSQVAGVKVDGNTMSCDIVIIAMGPWSGQSSSWFSSLSEQTSATKTTKKSSKRQSSLFQIPIVGQRAHSIVLKPEKPVTAHALFVHYTNKFMQQTEPEVYPRPTGEVYICGGTDAQPLPENPNDVTYNPESCQRLVDFAGSLSQQLKTATLEKRQACYLPISNVKGPLIGKLFENHVDDVYIASGHTCWGILTSPATGLAVSELILDGSSKTVDISAFNPSKLIK